MDVALYIYDFGLRKKLFSFKSHFFEEFGLSSIDRFIFFREGVKIVKDPVTVQYPDRFFRRRSGRSCGQGAEPGSFLSGHQADRSG